MADINRLEIFFPRTGQEARSGARDATFWHILAQFATMSRRLGESGQSPVHAKLGAAHWRALAAIAGWPGDTVSGLIHRLGITKQSLSPVLRDLTRADFVLIHPGAHDRRRRELYPTESGLRAWRTAMEGQARLLEAAFTAGGEDAAMGFFKITQILATLMNETE